nr:hypothetical protein [Borrelia persica]
MSGYARKNASNVLSLSNGYKNCLMDNRSKLHVVYYEKILL